MPAVAGAFYPDDGVLLEQTVRGLLDEAGKAEAESTGRCKALVVPHAGYVYSGPVAASAYVCLRPYCDEIRRVVLLGPSHHVSLQGLAISGASYFRTPLGSIPVDAEAEKELLTLSPVKLLPEAHRYEHSLEVQLPFLQIVLSSFSLVPLSVGNASAEEVDQVLEQIWGGEETLILVSSDLSHYLDYETACTMDRETTKAIEELRIDDINEHSACGVVALRGLLHVAKRRGLHVTTLDLHNSGDTGGPKDQVVGYGAYLLA
jgi:AmmeMemoRadiSam system protein B